MNSLFDVAIIGSGVAATAAAFECSKNGLKVAVIEKDLWGGTCPNKGCDPKKILWGAAQLVRYSHNIDSLFEGRIKTDWSSLIKFKRTFTQPFPAKRKDAFVKAGIEVIEGAAYFSSPHHLQVGSHTLKADKILIATGAKPRPLGIEGQQFAITSEQFLETAELPGSLLFIGGGFISFELAHIAATAGIDITIIHNDYNPLPVFDPDLVEKLLQITKEANIKFIPGSPAKEIKKNGSKTIVVTDKRTCQCDLVVHGAGRIADIDQLRLEQAEVKYGDAIIVNPYMQSISSPHIYAAGDCVQSSPPLTPVASMEGKTAAYNIINGNSKKMDYSVVPSVVFTLPPLASVGLGEERAKQQGWKYETDFTDTSNWYNSRRLGLKHTAIKIIKEANTGKLLGAHVLYPQAEDLINLFSMALKHNLSSGQIKETILTYPSDTSDIKYLI